MKRPLVLTVTGPDRPGLMARVVGLMAERGLNIVSVVSLPTGAGRAQFVFRVQPEPDAQLQAALTELGCRFSVGEPPLPDPPAQVA